MTDITDREPERFKRAVQAGCRAIDGGCVWPVCSACFARDNEIDIAIRAAILAWEAPQRLGGDQVYSGFANNLERGPMKG